MAKGVATEGIMPAWLQLAYFRVPMNGSTCLTLPRSIRSSMLIMISVVGAEVVVVEEKEEEDKARTDATIIETKKRRDNITIT